MTEAETTEAETTEAETTEAWMKAAAADVWFWG